MSDSDDNLRAEVVLIHRRLDEVQSTLAKAAAALERLARLEERDANTAQALDRAFSAISKHELRIRALEDAQPMQKLIANWVINGVWATTGIVGTLIANKLLGLF